MPITLTNEQEAVNHVLCGAAHSACVTEDAVTIVLDPNATPEQPEPPTEVLPPTTEMGILTVAMNDSTDNTVALRDATLTVTVSSHLMIDSEKMKVTDASDPSSLIVKRGADLSAIAAHAAGAPVSIWGKGKTASRRR